MLTATTEARVLTPEEEPIRCTICGLGARTGRFADDPASHVQTIVRNHSSSVEYLAADHEAVCDNIAPDGEVYYFGRIIATETVGPYTIITTREVRVDGEVEVSYSGYINREAIIPADWRGSGAEGAIARTAHSHATLDECLAFCIAYRHAGPNVATHLASHYVRGL